MQAERARRAAEERRSRQEALRREMVAANEVQRRLKAERLAAEQAQEAEFRRKMMERLAGESWACLVSNGICNDGAAADETWFDSE